MPDRAGESGRDVDDAIQPPRVRVLVADDHAIVRESLARLLRMEKDMEVVGQASDGQTVVEQVGRLAPDVVVMDVDMPVLSGIEATRQILAERPQTSVIGLSIHLEPHVAEQMREAGATNYLTKTGRCEELVAAIRACCSATADCPTRGTSSERAARPSCAG